MPSVQIRIRSRDVAVATDAIADALHASDYLAYAYLQTAQGNAAKLVWDRAQEISRTHSGGNAWAMAAIPARYAIERNDWDAAKALEVHAYPSIPHVPEHIRRGASERIHFGRYSVQAYVVVR